MSLWVTKARTPFRQGQLGKTSQASPMLVHAEWGVSTSSHAVYREVGCVPPSPIPVHAVAVGGGQALGFTVTFSSAPNES